jgi:hypothetical protein
LHNERQGSTNPRHQDNAAANLTAFPAAPITVRAIAPIKKEYVYSKLEK